MADSGTEGALVMDIAFWVVAVSTVIGAVGVVLLRDLFRASMSLVVCFIGVAGMFVLLRAEFLAVVQIVVYVGAISVIIIFAIMMTRDIEHGNPSNKLRLPAAAIAVGFLVSVFFVLLNTDWALPSFVEAVEGESQTQHHLTISNTVPSIAELLLKDFVLAFEVASLLLLSALVGALALVREH